jgi:hypothetical protein
MDTQLNTYYNIEDWYNDNKTYINDMYKIVLNGATANIFNNINYDDFVKFIYNNSSHKKTNYIMDTELDSDNLYTDDFYLFNNDDIDNLYYELVEYSEVNCIYVFDKPSLSDFINFCIDTSKHI